MNYELSKKLKDAGFPQEGEYYYVEEQGFAAEADSNGNTLLTRDGDPSLRVLDKRTAEYNNPPSTPFREILARYISLEELIEACGKDIGSILHDGDKWVVNSPVGKGDFVVRHSCPSKTLDEAVANLWLETRGNKE